MNKIGETINPEVAAEWLSAVVIGYQSAHALTECLSALARAGVPTIFVDNASRDDSKRIAQNLGAEVVVNALNEGFGRAANIGAARVITPYVLIMNPDAILADGAVGHLLAAARRYPEAALLAPHLHDLEGATDFAKASSLAPYLNVGPMAQPEGDCCVACASGAAMMIRMEAFRAIGGFDPNIFLYFEDDDLTRRLIDAGGSLVHVHAAIIAHAQGQSSAPEPSAQFRKHWHFIWSRCYVLHKFGRSLSATSLLIKTARRLAVATLTFNARRRTISAAQFAAVIAWASGRSALQQQGLDYAAGAMTSAPTPNVDADRAGLK